MSDGDIRDKVEAMFPPPPYPSWDKPASIGDLLNAMITIRACTVDIFIIFSALQRGDAAQAKEQIEKLDVNDEAIRDLIIRYLREAQKNGE